MSSLNDEYGCSLTPLPDNEGPDDLLFPRDMFSLEIAASFIRLPPQNGDGEYDEDEMYNADCEVAEDTFLVERSLLMDEPEASSRPIVAGYLESLGVPGEDFLVDRILRGVRELGRQRYYLGRKVIHIRVNIDLPPTIPFDDAVLHEDGNYEDNNNDDDDVAGPATRSTIEALKRVRIEEGGGEKQQCPICLEEIRDGSEAIMLSCSHVYDCDCIVKWLEKRGDCPLCRSRIASVWLPLCKSNS